MAKEELEVEFRKFGDVVEFRFFRDRNTACVEFPDLEDATRGMKVMNGKRLGGGQIRVDFPRSQSTKKVDCVISISTSANGYIWS